jgi:acetyl esterase/lipase
MKENCTMPIAITRRKLLAAAATAVPGLCHAAKSITSPEISEQTSAPEQVWAPTPDGNKATGILRRPPSRAKAPIMIFLHGGLTSIPVAKLRQWSVTAPTQCRALAAGYAILIPTFRNRDQDPQSTVALADCLAMVRYAKKLASVDPESVVVYGCSGGGSLALEIAGEEQLAAIVAEEPATVLFTGMMNKNTPKAGATYSGNDSMAAMQSPKQFYTPELQRFTRDKIRKIKCPVLIAHGDKHPINNVNEQIVIPELKAAGKEMQEIGFKDQPHCFGFHGDRRIDGAAELFVKIQEFLEPRLKTKPKPVDAGLIRQVPLTPATALLRDPMGSSCFAGT